MLDKTYNDAIAYLKNLGRERQGQIKLQHWFLSEYSEYETWARICYNAEEIKYIEKQVLTRDGVVTHGGHPYISNHTCISFNTSDRRPHVAIEKIITQVKEFLSKPIESHDISVLSPCRKQHR